MDELIRDAVTGAALLILLWLVTWGRKRCLTMPADASAWRFSAHMLVYLACSLCVGWMMLT